jgi:DNA-binding transcriptional LysR family regulator
MLRFNGAMNDIHERERLRLPEQLAGIDLNLVVAFDALARERSVTRAARVMGVTQSAMSHTLRRLRALLRDPVLVRTGDGMVLTPRAASLVVPLRSGLVTLGRTLLTPSVFDPLTARRVFSLATLDLFDVLVMPPLLAHLRTAAPGLDLRLVSALRGRGGPTLSEQLETGEVDLATVPRFERSARGPAEPRAAGLVQRTLFRDGFACFLRADHPVLGGRAERAKPLTLESYLTLSHALVSPGGDAVGPVDEALAKRRLERRIVLSVPQFTAALSIVARSELVLTAPSALAGAGCRELGMVVLPPPLPLPEHTVSLVWHERFSSDAGHHWLREQLFVLAQTLQLELTALAGRSAGRTQRKRPTR